MKLALNRLLLAGLVCVATSASAQTATTLPPETGLWLTESGNLEVDIAPCGQALCGTVTRVIADRSMSHSDKSMEKAEGGSPVDTKILTDFVPSEDSKWKGRIYNRENGKTYDCLLSMAAPDQLKVHPYKGLPLFGKTQIWRRISRRDGS